MTRTLLTGATGTLGGALRPRLQAAGHEVRATSRDPPTGDAGEVDWVRMALPDGPGIQAAVEDVDVVIHAASDARGDSEAVDVRGTERLLAAAEDADVSNFLYVSIVGIDEVPFSYYQHKLAAERAVEESPVPSTIVRETQFFPFVDLLLGTVAKLPIWPLPTRIRIQPIDLGEAADAIVEWATEQAAGRVPDVGGPEVLTVGQIARAYREARGMRRPIVRLPIPGKTASAFRAGNATCPDRTVGTVRWEEWLAEKYEPDGADRHLSRRGAES